MTKKERQQMQAALERAVEEVGGPAEVAKFISKNFGHITPQAVCAWTVCPPRRVAQLALAVKAKGGKTTAMELYPNLFESLAA